MQFKRLDQNFAILVECKSETPFLKDSDLEQIDILFDWLNFAGCRIPVSIYTQIKLDKNVRMNMNSSYNQLFFINLKSDISQFFRNNEKDDGETDRSNISLVPVKKEPESTFNRIMISRGERFNFHGSSLPSANIVQISQPNLNNSMSSNNYSGTFARKMSIKPNSTTKGETMLANINNLSKINNFNRKGTFMKQSSLISEEESREILNQNSEDSV
jgi:hypothetical protein